MNEPKQVIIIRTDTNPKMRKGKMCASAAHASMKVIFDMMYERKPKYGIYKWFEKGLHIDKNSPLDNWINGIFKKVVVGATNNELINAYNKAKKNGIPCSLIEDKGLTEFGGDITITAAAIGPDHSDIVDNITGHLKLL
jgi:PTH2 family peptidyl-tRNA hydrolase